MPLKQRRIVEDADNTWNQQLMAACLTGNLEQAQRVVDHGADPIRARELTPFSFGCKLSPLVAVTLSLVQNIGADNKPLAVDDVKNRLNIVQYLMEKGATLNDLIELPYSTPALFCELGRDNSWSRDHKKADTEHTQQQQQRSHGIFSAGADRKKSLRLVGMDTRDTPNTPQGLSFTQSRKYGTVLHYLVSLKDHVSLFRLLHFTGAVPMALSLAGSDSDLKSASSSEATAPAKMCPVFPFSLLTALQQELEAGHTLDNEEDYIRPQTQSKSSNSPQLSPPSRPSSSSGRSFRQPLSKVLSMSSTMMRTHTSRLQVENDGTVWNPFLMLLPHPVFPTLASHFASVDIKRTQTDEGDSRTLRSTAFLDFSVKTTADNPFNGIPETTRSGKKNRTLNPAHEAPPSAQTTTTHDDSSFIPRTALELASAQCDTMATRLLSFYSVGETSTADSSAATPESDPARTILVNGFQSELARACSTGDLAHVEALLDAGGADGATLTQLSEDGLYTLIHYSVAHRPVLDYLVRRRGLKIDIENAFGESALVSLIRYGTGRNSLNAIKDSPCSYDVAKLASLPPCAVRNYILAPFTLGSNVSQQPRLSTMSVAMTNTRGATHSTAGARQGRSNTPAAVPFSGNAVSHRGDNLRSIVASSNVVHVINSEEMVRMWSFTDRPTAELIQNLVDYGANIHGHIPEVEYPLRYVAYAVEMEEQGRQSASTASAANTNGLSLSKERDGAAGGSSRQSQRNAAKASGNGGGNATLFSGKVAKNSPRSGSRALSPAAGSHGSHRSRAPAGTPGADVNLHPRSSLSEDVARHAMNFHQQLSTFEEEGGSGGGSRDITSGLTSDIPSWSPTGNLQAQTPRDSDSTASLVAARIPLRATPLMHAIFNYHPELIRKFVVEYRVDLMRRDSQGASALHYAAAWCPPGETSVLELFLSPLVNNIQSSNSGVPIDVNAVDMAGRTPLYYATAAGNVTTMKWLLQLGSAVRAGRPDKNGLTPLHVAVRKNHPRAVAVLVRHSAKILEVLSEPALLPGAFGGKGRNEGGMFRSRRRPSFSQRHLPLGASPSSPGLSFLGGGHSKGGSAGSSASLPVLNRPPSVSQLRSLHAAAVPPFETHACVNVEAIDDIESATAMEMAVKHECHPDIVRVLLYEAGASLGRPSGLPTGGSLLHLAVAQNKPIYVQLMLDCYADPDELDDEQCTPLFRALLSLKDANFEEPPQMLVEPTMGEPCTGKEGAASGSLSKFETTLEIISLLLKNGAQPGMQSFITLQTQFHIAAQLGLPPRVFKLLFGDYDKDYNSRANGIYLNSTTSLRRQASDLASMEWKNLSSEALPNTYSADTNVAGSDTASTNAASTRRLQRFGRQYHQQDKFHDGVDRFFSFVSDSHGVNASGGDDIVMPADHSMARLASTGKGPKISYSPDASLIVNDALLITDAQLRTPLHYLCAHADRARQLSVLPTLLRILALPSSDAGSSGAGKYDLRNNNGGCRVFDRELAQAMCRVSDCEGRRPLHAACRAHFVEAVHALLEVDPESVFVVDAHGNTPLHDCVSGNCYGYLDPCIMQSSRDPSGGREEGGGEWGTGDTRAAIEAVIEAVARTVRSCIPHPLEGFPTPPLSSFPEALEGRNQGGWNRREATITSQVKQFLEQSPFFNYGPSRYMPPGSLANKGAANKGADLEYRRSNCVLISDWVAYLNLVDEQGRSALLLAGERGDTVAASALLRVSTKG
ncbi:unnamed protein product [Phytomonas sp. EM1]|nr:unnamed protein product [Phytomonas sp. EM1]|eukprot:CCW61332.1 unnamed protein product [Phytomonas sp. isolate EM1]